MLQRVIAVGTVISNRLRIDQLLGEGGMGVVASATHLELGHRVAIKFMRDELAANREVAERFMREARAVVNLKTEHVCRVLDVGRLDSGAPYIVMELLEGTDLQKLVSHKPLPIPLATEYILQACIALAEAHQAGIIHRDLKPANMFLTRRLDGRPLIKVLDFGIAKAVAETNLQLTTQSPMGSPPYMSPEQLYSARDVDVRTDIWSLGVTLYQLVSGRLPFVAKSIAEIAIQAASYPPPPLGIDPALEAVIFRCLEKDRTRRYPDVAALATDLARFAGPPGTLYAQSVAQIIRPGAASIGGFGGTQATFGTAPPHGMSQIPPPVTPAPTGGASTAGMTEKKGMAPIIAAALVLAVAGIVIAVIVTQSSKPESQPVAAVRDAGAIAVVTPDAAPIADAGVVVIAQAPDAGVDKPPRRRDTTRTDKPKDPAKPPPKDPAKPPPPLPPAEDSKLSKLCNTGLGGTLGKFAGVTPPDVTAKCMCLRGDKAAAQKAFDRVEVDDRPAVRRACASRGIKLRE